MKIKIFVDEVLKFEETVTDDVMLNSVRIKDFSVFDFIHVKNDYPKPYVEKTYSLDGNESFKLIFSSHEVFQESIRLMKNFSGLTVMDLHFDNVHVLAETV